MRIPVLPLIVLLLAALPASPTVASAITAANDTEAVVLKDFEALSAGDVEGLAAVFAPRIEIYRLPTEAHTLVGPRSDRMRTREELRAYFKAAFVAQPPMRHEVLEMVSLHDLAVVRVAIHMPDGAPPEHAFTAFRVRNGLIEGIWHIAREPAAAPQSGAAAKAVIRQLGNANNRGDADAVVGLYHPDAKHFHARRDPAKLGGAPPARVIDEASRRRFYRELYAEGPRSQVDLVDSVALSEWVATRERYTDPDGSPRDHLTIYRVRDGLIIDEWHLAP
ncbi:nuclear transport factor 2 family protein [Luteimonas suaedae]|uniref:nuclear transport factor 2 family protein n=1 Tax=Luteimonas suaedae TaxID=2605430 RepID=UPI0016592B9B|nr:nuclear transport factor 2 family protein [Luteimonas suaedae]